MTNNIRILAVLGCDWAIGMALFVIACLGSGWCNANLTPNINLYQTWFLLWLAPFLCFAMWRLRIGWRSGGRQLLLLFAVFLACAQTMTLLLGDDDSWQSILIHFIAVNASLFLALWLCPAGNEQTENTGDNRVLYRESDGERKRDR